MEPQENWYTLLRPLWKNCMRGEAFWSIDCSANYRLLAVALKNAANQIAVYVAMKNVQAQSAAKNLFSSAVGFDEIMEIRKRISNCLVPIK